MKAKKLILEALSLRDSSILVDPPLSPLPETLSKNVTEIANSVLTPEEIKITSCDVPELPKATRSKEYSCETVIRAFLRRAALAQKLVCNLASLTLGLDLGFKSRR
jgi:amidase